MKSQGKEISPGITGFIKSNPKLVVATVTATAGLMLAYSLYKNARKGDGIEVKPDGTIKIEPKHTGEAIASCVKAKEDVKAIIVATNPKAHSINIETEGASVTLGLDPAAPQYVLDAAERLSSSNPRRP